MSAGLAPKPSVSNVFLRVVSRVHQDCVGYIICTYTQALLSSLNTKTGLYPLTHSTSNLTTAITQMYALPNTLAMASNLLPSDVILRGFGYEPDAF